MLITEYKPPATPSSGSTNIITTSPATANKTMTAAATGTLTLPEAIGRLRLTGCNRSSERSIKSLRR